MDKLAKARRAVIETPRLRLMACDADLTAAILEDKSRAECFLNADLHCEWPGDDTLGFLPFQVMRLRAHPEEFLWGIWLMLLKRERRRPVVIGDLGYKGPPDREGAVDLGYGIVPEMRLKGYTFEAAGALVAWAFAHPDVRLVTSSCDESNEGSIRILEKLGMKRHGKDGRLIKWALHRGRKSG